MPRAMEIVTPLGADVLLFHRMHAHGPILQEAIGEAAGRCADVEAYHPCGRDAEVIERSLHLDAAAADEARARQ